MNSRCGNVALVGRPNVGKSTLLNCILGEKISITSRKPQTTRHQLQGIKTQDNVQAIYVDTPGIHRDNKKALNKQMNRTASRVMQDVDVVVYLVEALKFTEDDEWVLDILSRVTAPVILAINKIDRIDDKRQLLLFIESLAVKREFTAIFPISAKNRLQITELETEIAKHLPEAPFIFAEDDLTDLPDKFLASEFIREQLMRQLGQELPYSTTVAIEQFIEKDNKVLHIAAVIYVEKESQKKMIIGKEGEKLKAIATAARLNLEGLFEQKVFLQVWVKVKKGWADDERALKTLGY